MSEQHESLEEVTDLGSPADANLYALMCDMADKNEAHYGKQRRAGMEEAKRIIDEATDEGDWSEQYIAMGRGFSSLLSAAIDKEGGDDE